MCPNISWAHSRTIPPTWRRRNGSVELLAERDLLCLAWPEEFGGRGASVWEQTVVREEMWAHHEPRGAQYMGVNWVGPDHHAPRHTKTSSASTSRPSPAAK